MFFLAEEIKITEKEIQNLYQTHPYLIEKRFLNQKTYPQYILPSGFADIVIFLENEIVAIELKIDPLEISHLLQLYGYLEDLKIEIRKNIKIKGILIGKEPKINLNNSLKNLPLEIKIMILGKDLTIKIKICSNCRLANDYKASICFNCNKREFFK